MLIQIHENYKLIEKQGGHGQKWVCPLWSQDSNLLMQYFLGGDGQKMGVLGLGTLLHLKNELMK